MSKSLLSNREQNILNELYFFHGFVFKALLPQDLTPSKKDHRLKSHREINREIRMQNRLIKQRQQQKIRNY